MRPITLAATAALLSAGSATLGQPQAQKPLTKSDFIKKIDVGFNAMDTNHDGVVTKAELAAELQRELNDARRRATEQLRKQFNQLDTNHDGQLSFAEFSAVVSNIHSAETPDQKLQELDTNHDGKISAAEYRAPELARFNKIDTNHDGVISRAEYQAWVDGRFSKLDTNGDGVVDADEIATSPAAVERVQKRADKFVSHYDTSGSGQVSKSDFEAKEMQRFDRMSDGADSITEGQFAAAHRPFAHRHGAAPQPDNNDGN